MASIEVKHIEFDDDGTEIITVETVEITEADILAQAQMAAVARIAEIKTELAVLDQRRIRPMAEGDTDYLATLNAQAVALREELQQLTLS